MMPAADVLQEYLLPLQPFLDDKSISEILINRPGYVWIENRQGLKEQTVEALTHRHLIGLAELIGRYSGQRLNGKTPLLSGILPSCHRVQIVLPPATLNGSIVIAIRKQVIKEVSFKDYEAMGAFKDTQSFFLNSLSNASEEKDKNTHRFYLNDDPETQALKKRFAGQSYAAFLKAAILAKKNILISGATSTGKTTFLNACLQEIPDNEHIVTLEDVREIYPPNPNRHTALLTSKGQQGTADLTMQDLIQASVRLRPDRLIIGEIRGSEALDLIHALSTGHDGSLTSLHASNPALAFMRLVHMVKLSGTNLSRQDILNDLHAVIDIVVQLKRRLEGQEMHRFVSHIYYKDG